MNMYLPFGVFGCPFHILVKFNGIKNASCLTAKIWNSRRGCI